jgi:hypothetical protein
MSASPTIRRPFINTDAISILIIIIIIYYYTIIPPSCYCVILLQFLSSYFIGAGGRFWYYSSMHHFRSEFTFDTDHFELEMERKQARTFTQKLL